MPSRSGAPHSVVVGLLPTAGNNLAAVVATTLALDFPTVRELVVVGIAGAVPNPEKPDQHVRLGDIVASGERGVIQYDLLKRAGDRDDHRPLPRAPSFRLLLAAKRLESEHRAGKRPWIEALPRADHLLNSLRPDQEDRLRETPPAEGWVTHPIDPDRVEGEPRVFLGTIGSGNIVLKDAVQRDELRDRFDLRAFEMEASGIADTSWCLRRDYFAVRGTCDYCDKDKNNVWHGHASIVAAAYLRALLAATDNDLQPTATDPRSTLVALSGVVRERIAPAAGESRVYGVITVCVGIAFALLGISWPDAYTPVVTFFAGALIAVLILGSPWRAAVTRKRRASSVLRGLESDPSPEDYERLARKIAEISRR
jgi:nucleoside phosphorylase